MEAELVPLASARALAAGERELVEALVERSGNESLRAQAASARVISECSCPCPSVGLASDAPAASDLEPWVPIEAQTADGVDVILHVMDGRLYELEIWSGALGGEARPEIPSAASLRWPDARTGP